MKTNKPHKHGNKWRIRWYDENGERHVEGHEKYADAVDALNEHQNKVNKIKKGLMASPPKDKTFDNLCDYWIEKRIPLKRSGADDMSIIRAHLRPFFGNYLLRKIDTELADDFISNRVDERGLSYKTVHNHLTLLITMLNAAVDLNYIIKAPKINKPKTHLFSTDFSYLKTMEEIDRFLSATIDEGKLVYTFYSLALFTGMRAGEIAMLEWSDISFDKRHIIVQRSFNGPTKSGQVRYVPILDALLPTLIEWKNIRSDDKIVFPNRSGKLHQESASIFQETLHRVLDRAEFPKTTTSSGRTKNYITFHSLRHSFASHWVMNGGDIFKLKKILGHADVKMTMRYSHLNPDAYAVDYDRLGSLPPLDLSNITQFPVAASRH